MLNNNLMQAGKAVAVLTAAIAALLGAAYAQEIAPPSDTTRFVLDTALLIAASLGALMFVFAYGLRDVGLARVQNAPGVCLRMMGLLAVAAIAFWLTGYNLIEMVEKGGLLGEFQVWRINDDDPVTAGHSSGVYWFWRMAPAAMTAAIVSSAVSERVKLWSFLIFAAALTGLIYPIVASWVWGGGYLADAWSFYDFGGAGAIHMTAGAAALSAAFVVGPRSGKYADGIARRQTPTTMQPLVAFGAGLILVSWLLVLAGMVKSFSSLETAITIGTITVNSLVAAAGGVLAALFLTQVVYRRVGLVTVSCAAAGGLVSIAADPLHPALWQAAMIGAVGGVIVTVAPPFLDRFRIDDAGLVVPTHLLCGGWGVIVVAWTNPDAWAAGQLVGAAAIGLFSALLSLLIWVALKYTLGARLRSADDARAAVAENFSPETPNR